MVTALAIGAAVLTFVIVFGVCVPFLSGVIDALNESERER